VELKETAKRIYNSFLTPDSEFELNITQKTVKPIHEIITKQEDLITNNLFHKISFEVQWMLEDSLEKFQHTIDQQRQKQSKSPFGFLTTGSNSRGTSTVDTDFDLESFEEVFTEQMAKTSKKSSIKFFKKIVMKETSFKQPKSLPSSKDSTGPIKKVESFRDFEMLKNDFSSFKKVERRNSFVFIPSPIEIQEDEAKIIE